MATDRHEASSARRARSFVAIWRLIIATPAPVAARWPPFGERLIFPWPIAWWLAAPRPIAPRFFAPRFVAACLAQTFRRRAGGLVLPRLSLRSRPGRFGLPWPIAS